MKIVVGMSGGVDSSVTALLLTKAGHEVIGLSLQIWDQRYRTNPKTCCSHEAALAAKTTCIRLGIKHITVDARNVFMEQVIEPFCKSYLTGETPNPCVLCNRFIKFSFLLSKADELGADAVATGHYAQIERVKTGNIFSLLKGIDPRKDQSYFLYVMKQAELSRTILPLGTLHKTEVREIAKHENMASADRPESQEICFVGTGSYTNFISEVLPEAVIPGPIVDSSGHLLGEHRGISCYTIGQRRGLGIAAGVRRYVIKIDRDTNTVVLGSREEGMENRYLVHDVNWISPMPESGRFEAAVKIRSTMKEAPASIKVVENDKAEIEFKFPQWAPAPGQAAVFYKDNEVLGGGTVSIV